MAGKIDERLKALNIELPDAPTPAAAYVPYVRSGAQLHIAGQVPLKGGELAYRGLVGDVLALEDGAAAARQCAINILAQARAALDGDLDRIVRIVRLGGYVASEASFRDQHLVVNGASELMAEVFGDAGKHARIAVGVGSLPLDAPVMVDAVIEIG